MENTTQNKAVVLLSGGLMSTVLALKLLEDGKDLTALTIVGERTSDPKIREARQSAMLMCRFYGINHELVDISSLQAVIAKYNMIDQAPSEEDADLTDDQLHEKDRNAVASIEPSPELLTAMGMQLAQSLGTDQVFMGKPVEGVDLKAELSRLLGVLQPRLTEAPWAPWRETVKTETPTAQN